VLYRLSRTLIEEMRQQKARGRLDIMAALLNVQEKELEAIIKYGVVTERWLHWKFICDAVVECYVGRQERQFWKKHKVEYRPK
jgi:hypothetical protein